MEVLHRRVVPRIPHYLNGAACKLRPIVPPEARLHVGLLVFIPNKSNPARYYLGAS